ncbi:transcriptional regulator, LysR family [Thermosinus carboxydivorans Nor1]|uniref:Transcriptional regulator, LysR family n=1 Tax=Thermosinus carboxydivorans Nor1 TaxID=401526 RepID=A1HNF5_9FIRM|nr:LysR family transcriptional regulator [Thermosinus carboxydivorans]EAX48314.1 transcriptional regulator, LysR family [Thermosinus carboxydivorans Nor1]
MDDKDWLILKTICEEKNITKASERLYISQPALTYRLKNLEAEFKTKLFHRSTSGVFLTPQGEYLRKYAEEMLQRLQLVKDHLANMENTIQGTLRLGVSSIFAHYQLPTILKTFVEQFPDIEITVKTGLSYQINKLLHKEEIAVAILRGDYSWPETKILLREEPICLATHKKISLDKLPSYPGISYNTDSSLQAMIENWWHERYSCPPHITMEVDKMDTCIQLVHSGLGWAILPAIGLDNQPSLFTQELFWQNGEPLVRRTWLLCRHSALNLLPVKAFVEFITTRELYAAYTNTPK